MRHGSPNSGLMLSFMTIMQPVVGADHDRYIRYISRSSCFTCTASIRLNIKLGVFEAKLRPVHDPRTHQSRGREASRGNSIYMYASIHTAVGICGR